MNAQLAHPSKAELSAFALGKLPEESSATIEYHLAECDACSATLASVADDTLIGLLVEGEDASADGEAWIDVRLDPEQTAAHTATVAVGVPDDLADHARYRVLRLLGRGGMGDVYLAEHRLMERPVAIKVMKRRLMGRADAVERFRREVKAAAQLKHENIVTAYDAEQAGDLHLLVMEYVDGHDLATEVKQRGPLPIHEACEYARQAALGLAHAHAQGMVHRDIKPHNLMLVDGHVRILDFGLAQVVQAAAVPDGTAEVQASSLTGVHSILGTPDYIAPEQIHNARATDHRADLYSLGATLFFLLTGHPPFSEGSATERIEGHLSRDPADVREVRPDIPEDLAHVVRRLMAKVPIQRYQTAEMVAAALAPFCREPAATASAPATAGGSLWNWALAPILAAIFAGGAWGFWQIVITIVDRDGNRDETILPEGSRVVIEGSGGRAGGGAWRTPAHPGHPRGAVIGRHHGAVYDVTFSRDGKRVVSAGSDDLIRVWDVENGREAQFDGHQLSAEARLASPGHGTLAVAFTPDGQQVLSGGWDGTGRLWEIASGDEVARFGPHSRLVYAVDVSPDGKIAATAHCRWEQSKDPELNHARLWDIETGELLHELKGHEHGLTDVSFSPDGRLVATSSPDATVRLWDVETGEQLHVLKHATKVHEARFSPDGKTIAAACAGTLVTNGKINDPDATIVVLWDAETGQQLRTIRGHAGSIRGLDFSPDGRYLVTGSGLDHLGSEPDPVPSVEYSIRVWDVATGEEVFRFSSDAPLHRVRFSPDGRQILSCDEHSAVRLWRLPEKLAATQKSEPAESEQGKLPIRFRITDEPITKADDVFPPHGDWAFKVEGDRYVRLFEVNEPGVEDCVLIYRAKLRAEDVNRAYLEMWVRMPDGREAFSKGLERPVQGTSGWASYQIPFFLKKGERPDLVKLGVTVEGGGTIWVEDVELLVNSPAELGTEKTTESENPTSSAVAPEHGALRTREGFYLRAVLGGGDDLRADAPEPKTSELFVLEWLDESQTKVRLRTREGHYVHAALGGGEDVDAKRRQPGSSEVFDVEWIDRDRGRLRLRTREGYYLHPVGGGGGDVDAKVREPGSSEVLTLVPAAGLDDEADRE